MSTHCHLRGEQTAGLRAGHCSWGEAGLRLRSTLKLEKRCTESRACVVRPGGHRSTSGAQLLREKHKQFQKA